MQETKLFDRKLKAKLAIKNDIQSVKRSKRYKAYIAGPLYVVLFIYVLIMPFVTAPHWCADYYGGKNKWAWTFDCSVAGSVHIDSSGYNKPIRLSGGT